VVAQDMHTLLLAFVSEMISKDIRVYLFKGNAVLKKPSVNNFHRFGSLDLAMDAIEIQRVKRYRFCQFVIIEYFRGTSKIILVC